MKLANTGGGSSCEHTVYDSDCERLCAYLKNDSMIRWSLGCSQEDIDRARARLAKRRKAVKDPYLPGGYIGAQNDEDQRRKLSVPANKRYLEAIAKARANG